MIIRDLPHCPAGNHRKHWSLLALIGCCAGLGCNSSTSNPGASLRTVTFPSASSEQWVKQSLIATSSTGTATQDDTTNLSLSPQGNIIALGRVIPTPSSLSTTPPTQEQEFLTSYDANGNQVNTTSFSQGILPDTDVLAVGTPDGNYVATANPETIGNIPWLLPLNLEKFSSTGAALWTATLPTTGQYAQLVLSGIVADRSGNVYVSGTTGGAVNGLWGIFFAKFDGDSGALLWQHNYIAVGNLTQLTNLATDPDGNLYVTGMGNGNFITPQQSPSMQDSFLTKLDSNTGNTIWSISAPSGISYTSVAVSSNRKWLHHRPSAKLCACWFYCRIFPAKRDFLMAETAGRCDVAADQRHHRRQWRCGLHGRRSGRSILESRLGFRRSLSCQN